NTCRTESITSSDPNSWACTNMPLASVSNPSSYRNRSRTRASYLALNRYIFQRQFSQSSSRLYSSFTASHNNFVPTTEPLGLIGAAQYVSRGHNPSATWSAAGEHRK